MFTASQLCYPNTDGIYVYSSKSNQSVLRLELLWSFLLVRIAFTFAVVKLTRAFTAGTTLVTPFGMDSVHVWYGQHLRLP